MFDAGAVVGRMVLDRAQWVQGIRTVQRDIENLQDRMTRATRQMERVVDNVANGFESLGTTIKQVGNELSRTGKNLAFFGAAMAGPLLLAFNSMKSVSPQVSEEIRRLTNVTRNFQLVIANAMVPVIERLVNFLGGLFKAFNSMNPALRDQIIQWTLITGILLTVGGVFLSITGRVFTLVGTFARLIGSVIAFLGWFGLLAAAIIVVIASFGKLEEFARFTLEMIETLTYEVLSAVLALGNGMLKAFEAGAYALQKFYELLGLIPGAIGEPYRNAAKGIDQLRDKLKGMINTNVEVIDSLKSKAREAFGGNGDFTKGLDWAMAKIKELQEQIKNFGNLKVDVKPILDATKLIEQGWVRTAEGMASSFSNVFYDGITGQLKSLQEYFAEFGRVVLRIITDVLAKLLLARLFGGLGGPIGAAFSGLTGHADGIDEVPQSGIYRLHAGERVVPKYDANNGGQGVTIDIHNLITNDAIAASMASKPGRNTIVNVIRADANQRGPTRSMIRGN